MLTSELSLLAIYGLFVALTLVLQSSGVMAQLGMGYMLSSRDEHRTAAGIAARLERAERNSVTALALIAPPVLILALRDNFSAQSLLCMQVFVVARLVYLPTYAFGITLVRTLTWLAGFAATVLLYFLAL